MMRHSILAAVAASAAMAAAAAVPPAYLAHLPPEQHGASGIDYITGGKTPEEAAAVKRAAQEFPLELVFAEHDGGKAKELYDNPVTIRDDAGKVVFAGRTDGPYFLAKLPPGEYTVTTHWDSWTFTKPVTIAPDERERVVFEWKKPAINAGDVENG